MMSPHDIPSKLAPPPTAKDHHDHQQQAGSAARKPGGRPAAQEHGLKCPRCDSPNTKFCYYNNYSLTQPRHFCKTCRRYWTKGGALRNVPIGGGCRKNKKVRSSRLTSSCDPGSSNPDHLSGLKFLHGLGGGGASASLEFQLGGLPFPSRVHQGAPVFNDSSSSSSQFPDPSGGVNYPFCPCPGGASAAVQGSVAASIESLSSMNQDLHWKLQQQRLSILSAHKEAGEGPAEWFFGNSSYPSSAAAWGPDVHLQYSALP